MVAAAAVRAPTTVSITWPTFHAMHGQPGGATGVDDAFASNWGPGIGAEITGRNKFGPHRGPWQDQEWKGWWGDNPPFHTPVFVLTHHLRPSVKTCGSGGCRGAVGWRAFDEPAVAEGRVGALLC